MRRLLLPLLLLSALPASAAVTGTVVAGDGTPVAGARVRAFAREPFSAVAARLLSPTPEATPVATAETAADGRFSVDAKGNAAVDLVVDAAGRDSAGIDAADGDDAGTIVLRAPDKARRIKITADGKPLPNALVYLGHSLLVRTAADGTFERDFTGEAGFVIHPDYGVSTAAAVLGGEVLIHRGSALRGRVVARDGTTLVAGALIYAGGWPLARSGDDGTFTIAHAPARAHALLATKGSEAGSATADAAKPVTIRLGTAASLSGTVMAKGDVPVAGATVNALSEGEIYSAVTDAKGRYSIAALPPGTYQGHASHPSFVTARNSNVHVAAATAHAFSLQPRSRVSGVVLGEDKKPVAGAFVASASRIAVTNPSGEFTVRLTESGPLLVEAWKSGYAVTISPLITVQPGETKSGLTLTLQRGFPLQVKVVDSDKQPVANAAVDFNLTGYADTMRTVPVPCSVVDRLKCRLTGADGTMETRLGEGKYNIRVGGADFVTKDLPQQALTARSSPLVVTVERGAEVSGRVLFADGTPVADARVITSVGIGGGSAVTDASGAFTLKQLPRKAQSLTAVMTDEMPLRSKPVPVTPPARNVTITFPRPSRVEGRVIDRETSQPLTTFNVAVLQRGMGGLRGVDVNSSDGAFVLKRVLPGAVDLRVTAPGYVAGTLSDLSVEEGKDLTGVEVKLDRGVRVAGHVTAGGSAAAGAQVRAGTRARRMPASTETDANGDYVLDGVAPGEQVFDFVKQGFVTKHKTVEVEAGKDLRVDADLDRGREIRGRVIDRNGQPVRMAGASARLPGTGFVPAVTTDDDGQFTISGLEDGRYTVTAQKSGWVGASIDDVDPASARPLTLTLDRGGTITGRVTGLAPEELAQVRVSAAARNTSSSQQTDAAGNFTLSGIPDGSVTINAYKQGMPMRQAPPKTVEVVNGSAPPVEIDFNAGVAIHGRVTRNGLPVNGGNLVFSARGRNVGRSPYASIGPDGAYEVNVPDAGDYDVRVLTMGGINDNIPYTVVGSATFDIDLKGGAVHGVVLDADSGAPLPDARVYAAPASQGLRTSRNAMSDSNGAFTLDVLPDGSYTFRAERERYAPASQIVTVSGGSAAPVELRLTRGQEAVIRVVDADSGAPIDAGVALIDEQTKKYVGGSGYGRGEDGAVHVWAAPGRYSAHVNAPAYLNANAEVVVPGPEVRVALQRAGTIVIRSRSGGRFRLVPPASAGGGVVGGIVGGVVGGVNGPRSGISIPAGGNVPLGSLAAGVYEIDKLGDDGKTVVRRYSVVLAAGQTVTVDAD